jgi:hypothetical protein
MTPASNSAVIVVAAAVKTPACDPVRYARSTNLPHRTPLHPTKRLQTAPEGKPHA